MTRFNFLRRFFRPRMPRKRSSLQFIGINGNTYFRRQSDIIRLEPGDVAGDGKVCDADHVAPNGVSIAQIAYAIALIEGRIAVTDNPYGNLTRSRLGLD
jgi:hypothetical protein